MDAGHSLFEHLIVSTFMRLKVGGDLSLMEVTPMKRICLRKSWPYDKPWIRLLPHLEKDLSCGLVGLFLLNMFQWSPQDHLPWI